jgi:hypothetical protein
MSTHKDSQKRFFIPNLFNTIGALLGGLTLAINSPSLAASIDLTLWQTIGDVSIIAGGTGANLSNDGLNNDDGSLGNFNFSGNPAELVGFNGPLETFLGVNASDLDLGGTAWEGSALKTTITVGAGDSLSYNWNFLTNETSPTIDPLIGPQKDYAFFMVNSTIVKLADYTNTLLPSNPFDSETGLQMGNYTFSQAGTYTIAFGIVDLNDYPITSALSLSNPILNSGNPPPTSVPESDNILGILLLGGLGFWQLLKGTR